MTNDPYASAITFSFRRQPGDGRRAAGIGACRHEDGYLRRAARFPEGSDARPQVGRRDVVLDGRGRPAAVIETVEVTVRRFVEVDERFAFDEGEGFRTLVDWREGHRAYFERNGGFSPDMELLRERFRLIETLPRDERGDQTA